MNAIMLVVAVALIGADGRVLMQRRRLSRAHGGLWEFPGGKIEPGETAHAAAIREISEELGVRISASSLMSVGFACAPDSAGGGAGADVDKGGVSPLILLFATRQWHGEPVCLEDEEIGWFAPDALAALAMPPLDYPLARALLASPAGPGCQQQ